MRMLHKFLTVLSLTATATLAVSALPTSYYAEQSRLAEGTWRRVETDTTGIFQITADELRSLGFSNPEDVRVYGTPAIDASTNLFGVYPDDLVQAPSMYTADERLLFFAEGDVRGTLSGAHSANIERCYYDTKSVYFLCETAEKRNIYSIPFIEAESSKDYHYSLSIIEREVQNTGKGGVFYHGKTLAGGETECFSYKISDYYDLGEEHGAYFNFVGGIKSPKRIALELTFSDNASIINITSNKCGIVSDAYNFYSSISGDAIFALDTSDATVDIGITIPEDFSGSYAAVDYTYIVYPRRNRISGSELMLNLVDELKGTNFTFENVDDDVRVWDVSNPQNVYELELKQKSDGIVVCSATSGSRIVAFCPSAEHRSVRNAEVVSNSNLHGIATPDLLVICTESLLDAAEEYAAIHRELNNLDVVVATQNQVFNEFSSGIRTPAALRRFAKMLYDRNPEKLRYLTLYGTSTWDNRFLCTDRRDVLVCYECESFEQARDATTNYVSDTYFGILNDNYNTDNIALTKSNISIGRIAATDIGLARKYNEKSRQRLLQTPSAAAFKRVLKFSDDGDKGQHLFHSEEVARILLTNDSVFTISSADNLLYPWKDGRGEEATRKIKRSLSRGQGLFYYAGHGTSLDVTAEKLYTSNIARTLSYDYPPLAIFASCDIFPFDRETNSIAEIMTYTPRGGAIGIITTARQVFLDYNRSLSVALAQCYANASPGETGADVLRRGRNSLIDERISKSLGYNTLNYNYCGDPALPLDIPAYGIDAILPQSDEDNGIYTLSPLKPVIIEGSITDANGNVATDFNGTVLIEVYDSPSELLPIIRNNDDGGSTAVFCNDKLLAEFGTVATNGRFSTKIVLPEPPTSVGTKRIVITASDITHRRCAAAPLIKAYLADNTDEVSDDDMQQAPEIIEFYIDSDYFISPEAVAPSFIAHALISQPACGIATGNADIRSALKVTIDDSVTLPDLRSALRFGDDGFGYLEIPVSNLAQGRHEIRLEVFNNFGIGTSQTLSVLVGTEGVDGTLEVIGGDPAGESVEFQLSSECSSGTLIIVNSVGKTVYSNRNIAFPYTWDVKDSDGKRLFPGVYYAWVMLDNGSSLGSTPKTEFTVVK